MRNKTKNIIIVSLQPKLKVMENISAPVSPNVVDIILITQYKMYKKPRFYTARQFTLKICQNFTLQDKSVKLECFREKCEVFGALSRLVHWYKAKLTICCCQKDTNPCNPSDFTGLLPFQTLWKPFLWDEILYENVIWRGGIHLQNQIVSINSHCSADYSILLCPCI